MMVIILMIKSSTSNRYINATCVNIITPCVTHLCMGI